MVGARYIVTADPENIKAMLATQFDDFGKGERFSNDWRELMGHSVFNVDGVEWHNSRQRLRPLFTRQRISNLECFERHVQVLLPMLGSGETVDIKDLFSRFALDASGDFSLGRHIGSLQNPKSEAFDAFERIRRTQSLIERSGPFNVFLPRRQFRRDLAAIDAFMEPTIREAIALSQDELKERDKKDESYTFVQECAALSQNRNFLRDELMTVLIAGRDTTAVTLSFCLFELARNPDVVARLRQEIEDTLGLNRKPTYEDLKSMKFLSSILNETLRLYPVAPFNIRAAIKDTSLPRGGGPDGNEPIGLPAGTSVIYSTHMLRKSHIRDDSQKNFSMFICRVNLSFR
ncbi:hypothetical protein VTL71DRAFT_10120, partial [Oculimacula yallundae]